MSKGYPNDDKLKPDNGNRAIQIFWIFCACVLLFTCAHLDKVYHDNKPQTEVVKNDKANEVHTSSN